MAAKPTPPAKRRGGPTQPESARIGQQVLLRLAPDTIEDLARLAEARRMRLGEPRPNKSAVVAELVERAIIEAEMRGTVRGVD